MRKSHFNRISASARSKSGTPASGHRYNASGALSYIGHGGNSYSSSVGESNGVYLYFYMAGLHPSRVNNRAFALPLRCLSE